MNCGASFPYRTAVPKLEAGMIGCAPAMIFVLAGADVGCFDAASLERGRSCAGAIGRLKLVAVTTG